MPRSNFPLQMRMKAMRSRWALFILAWILNTNAEKSSRLGSMGPAEESRGRGGGERRRKSARNGSTPKFVSADPKNTGVSMPWRTLSRLNS